jgi:alanine-glyoxylate transaminase / serine-glyoxylate transaminase / serine-pyruvate transaminase
MNTYAELIPPFRLLLGPGPSNVNPRVLKAMSSPIVGHLDAYFFEIMNETTELLRYAFQTRNKLTIPISGTGSAGMEAALCNVVEPGDEVIVGLNGFFGERMAEIVSRCGGKVIALREGWGKVIEKEAVDDALKKSDASVVAIVHAETSTGVLQPLTEISRVVHEHGALFLVDAVTSLGGCELDVDTMSIDICYSGSQKCLNCPPGLAPITFNDKAINAIHNRKSKIQSWYFDISLIEKYWSEGRVYHHTAPVSMIYGLREGLRVVYEEGLQHRWQRHRRNSEAFMNGIEAMGLELHVEAEHRLPSLNAVSIPTGVSDKNVRATLLNQFDTEIGGGLGELSSKIWRVGLMGINSNEGTVCLVLEALERALKKEGYKLQLGESLKAVAESYSK